ncbi:hypothetical protein H9L39_18554 [Fusarium oxysporum f. sp. albedinis]|nr:hypothetical protein H9L39_18554 [Fusarium oxysporum f. sp. albedinis]
MALRWFEKVEGKAKKAVVGRSPRKRPGSFATITFAASLIHESCPRIHCYSGSEILHNASRPMT